LLAAFFLVDVFFLEAVFFLVEVFFFLDDGDLAEGLFLVEVFLAFFLVDFFLEEAALLVARFFTGATGTSMSFAGAAVTLWLARADAALAGMVEGVEGLIEI